MAAAFLTNFFGSGLTDERYAVEKFGAMADGDVRRCPDPAPKGGRNYRAKIVTAPLKEDKKMRSAPNKIDVCTGLKSRGAVRYRGSVLTSSFCDHRQKVSCGSLRGHPAGPTSRFGAGAGGGPSSVRFGISKEEAVMAYRDVETRHAQDSGRWHGWVAERCAWQVHQVWIEDAEPTGHGSPAVSLHPSIRQRRTDPHPAAG